MAGVVYYTGASREFLGVCAREEKSERRRRSKLVSCSPSFLNFQGAFSVNKYEGKCSFTFFFYSISGVRSAGYNLYGNKTLRIQRTLRRRGCGTKAWFPYDRPDRPSRLKKCSDDRNDHMETLPRRSQTTRMTETSSIAWIELSSIRTIGTIM